MNHQTNQRDCNGSCSTCPYGRTPWGTRETGCTKRPWNTRSSRSPFIGGSCPTTANTTWKNRSDSCSCGNSTSRSGSCPCKTASQAKSPCSCAESQRDGDCDEDCNLGAGITGILEGESLAMVYSPYQKFDSLYDPRQGLCQGTIFGKLDKPFHGERGCY